MVWKFKLAGLLLVAMTIMSDVALAIDTIANKSINASWGATRDVFEILLNPTVFVALLGALLAAVGYVVNLVLNWQASRRKAIDARITSLVKLDSLLEASWAIFKIQNKHADSLLDTIYENHPELIIKNRELGYEKEMSKAFPVINSEEKEKHEYIRSITTNSMSQINESLMDWLKADTYFRAQRQRRDIHGELAEQLSKLEAHLVLWQAKYKIWITPEKPEHALVYMADEQEYGVRFPSEIKDTVKKIIKKKQGG